MYFDRIKHTGNNLIVHDVCLQSSAQSSWKYNVSVFPPSVTFLVDGNFHARCRILLKPTEENDMEKQGKYITDISRLNNSAHPFLYSKSVRMP